jgi:NAD(P)-dependent dehydrogenase (short-subunit alcohol dehydrogenase family)
MKRFEGKPAPVAGSARGMGRAFARVDIRADARVAIAGMDVAATGCVSAR